MQQDEKRKLLTHIGKEEKKLSLFIGDIMLYVENPKRLTKNKYSLFKLVSIANLQDTR